MAEILLITAEEMTKTTILGGNVDLDKYRYCIFDAQITVLEPLLGTDLYEYIRDNKDTLAGDYLTLYDDYVVPILKFSATSTYIDIASYMVDNGGIYKHEAGGKTLPEVSEVSGLSAKYRSLANTYIQRFEKWICDNQLDEYSTNQDNVNARSFSTNIGWKL